MSLSAPPVVDGGRVSAYAVPTATPESDGTLSWEQTVLVLVELEAAGVSGLGYTYADAATARLIETQLLPLLRGRDATAVAGHWQVMVAALRNLGRSGITAMAVSAVDCALWDLKARLLEQPLVDLLGAVREQVPAYGSGGFTNYDPAQLERQLAGWAQASFPAVKMKIGREPDRDLERVRQAREAIGPVTELFVDANGALARQQALVLADRMAAFGVSWFEEPVPSSDLEGLRLLRDRSPVGMAISAGEYGYDPVYFRRMLEAQAIDVLQADATRCGGISGYLLTAALCEAFDMPLSSHCAPALHVALGCATWRTRHVEWFFDHSRIEAMLFDGAPQPTAGRLAPDRSRPGIGLAFRAADARHYAI